MKKVYGYIRVSTTKQGNGVSLQEQKDAIIRYATKNNLKIVDWFEEKETAAKQGRPLFNKMMQSLKKRKVEGAIIHKIDRSARNLKDWALIGDLIDQGIEVHFAHESLDLHERGGRLAADIQAVIASDYIRNLRDETKKGLYGRLKQGIYPFCAPTGYLNNGGGELKTIDPEQGPLVKKAFKLYATEKYSLSELTEKMKEYGLRNREGNPLYKSAIARLLRNPFYTGVIKVKDKTFTGIHEAIIPSYLFFEVQKILDDKTNGKTLKHEYLFNKLIKCEKCDRFITGEKQKGHVYYRCHTKGCVAKAYREDGVNLAIMSVIEYIKFYPEEIEKLNMMIEKSKKDWINTKAKLEESIKLQVKKATKKIERLTDILVENLISQEEFNSKKEKLLIERKGLESKLTVVEKEKEMIFVDSQKILDHIADLQKFYESKDDIWKKRTVKNISSNLSIDGKNLCISMKSPYSELSIRHGVPECCLSRDRVRTFRIPIVRKRNFSLPNYASYIIPEALFNLVSDLLGYVLKYIPRKHVDVDGRN